MRDLDRRLAARLLAIERQQAVARQRVKHRRDRLVRNIERVEFRPHDSPPGVSAPFSQRHQPQEDVSHGALSVAVRVEVETFGSCRQSARNSTDHLVGTQLDRVLGAALEEFGQAELKQRQRARLVGRIGYQRCDEPEFDHDAFPFGRPTDGLFYLIGRHGHQDFGSPCQQTAEVRVRERPIEHICAERGDEAQRAVGIDHCDAQRLQKEIAFFFIVGQGECLLELIDDEDDDAAGGSNTADASRRPRGPDRSRRRHTPAPSTATRSRASFESLHRASSPKHVRYERGGLIGDGAPS